MFIKIAIIIMTTISYILYKIFSFIYKGESYEDFIHNHLSNIINTVFATVGSLIGVFSPTSDEWHNIGVGIISTALKAVIGGIIGLLISVIGNKIVIPYIEKLKSK